jgi:uncharacterized protein
MVVGLTRVEDGVGVDVDVLLEAVMEGVLVTVRAQVPFVGECARCLDDVRGAVDVDAQELYAHPDLQARREADDASDTPLLDGDLLDLEPVLRDAVVLALPGTVLCDPGCPGLCPRCGARLADDPDHVHTDEVDPRWSALGALAAHSDPPFATPAPEEH